MRSRNLPSSKSFWISACGAAVAIWAVACAHESVYQDHDYYKMVETRTTNQVQGERSRETRELYCPSNRIPSGEDPTFWSDEELRARLKSKVCMRVVCVTDARGQRKCLAGGDQTLRPQLEKERQRVQGQS